MNLARTRALLAERGLRLRRELGQNYLVDDARAAQLVAHAGVEPGDVVVEVGTGLGTLTRALAARAARVVTIEIDAGVVAALRDLALLPDAVELVHADALDVDLAALVPPPPARTRLVANLPYSAATPLLRRMLDLRDTFASWSVMVQREVAARLVAGAGEDDYGSFAVLHALAARVERVVDVAPQAFFPVPKVVSSFVRITPLRGEGEPDRDELARIERVVRALFARRRKTIKNGLEGGGFGAAGLEALARVGIDARERAERLEPAALRALARALDELGAFARPGPRD
ncbi:MAG: 16S rRNA (adenine(1518)-N(6)/adenine(1519)-N(6))-dimethyltransferase RsmA [Myxococcota bacterium]